MTRKSDPWLLESVRALTGIRLHTLLVMGAVVLQQAAYSQSAITESSSGVILVGRSLTTALATEFTNATDKYVEITVTNRKGEQETAPKSQILGFIHYIALPSGSTPNNLSSEDFRVLESKIAAMKRIIALAPQASKLLEPQIDKLQAYYAVEYAKYQKVFAAHASTEKQKKEEKDFQTMCELLWLKLRDKGNNLAKCESHVKEIEALAAKSPTLRDNLLKWNNEKKRVLQLRDESMSLWSKIQQDHPEIFTLMKSLGDIREIPPDVQKSITEQNAKLTELHNSVAFPQLLEICQHEIQAYYLLSMLTKVNESVRSGKLEEALPIIQGVVKQSMNTIVDPYTPIKTVVTQYRDLIEDVQTRFQSQLARARKTEEEGTSKEALPEYEKANAIRQTPDVSRKIQVLKDMVGNR